MNTILTNIQNQFGGLQFNEEQHRYHVAGKEFTSVSHNVHKYEEYVDWDEKAMQVAIANGTTKEEVLREWDENKEEACTRGTRVHLFGERYVFDRSLKPSLLENGQPCGQEVAVTKFWNDLPSHIVPAHIELRMYHNLFNIAGTSDILLFNTQTRKFIIADYKTNKDLFKNFKNKTLTYPFTHLLDCPLNKYQIQLSFYQLLFELTGYKVESRKVIWLLKTGEYIMYDCEDLTPLLIKDLTQSN